MTAAVPGWASLSRAVVLAGMTVGIELLDPPLLLGLAAGHLAEMAFRASVSVEQRPSGLRLSVDMRPAGRNPGRA